MTRFAPIVGLALVVLAGVLGWAVYLILGGAIL